jgi:hypothetical protein
MAFRSERDEVVALHILLLQQQEIPASLVGEALEQRSLRSYQPLEWLLRSDAMEGALRRERRRAYMVLVRQMKSEFREFYRERLNTVGQLDFAAICEMNRRARRCVRKMLVCAALHFLHIRVDR